jgi:hypothetical protein
MDFWLEPWQVERGCYEIPVVGVPGAIGAQVATSHGAGAAAGSPGSSNVGAGAGGGVAGYLAAKGVGVSGTLSNPTLSALTPEGAAALGVSIGTVITGGAASYILNNFRIPAAQPAIPTHPTPAPIAPSPAPAPLPTQRPITVAPAPAPKPIVYTVGTHQLTLSAGTPAAQVRAAESQFSRNLAARSNVAAPELTSAPVSSPLSAQVAPAVPFPPLALGEGLEEIAQAGYENFFQPASNAIVSQVGKALNYPVTLGQQIGSMISPPASYQNYIQAQQGNQQNVPTTVNQPGSLPISPMLSPLNAQLPKATAAFQSKARQPGFVFGEYCPTCDPTIIPAIRSQCPDCSPDEIDQIVTQGVHGQEPREQILLRAQQQQLHHSIQVEQGQQTGQQISQQQQQIERFRSNERLTQSGQMQQTPSTIKEQLEEKQALLEQISQELMDLENQQTAQQLPQGNVSRETSQSQKSTRPLTQQYASQAKQPLQVQTAREAQNSRELTQLEQSKAEGKNPVKICFACESRQDALLFLNGEASGCSLMSEEAL